MREEGIREEMFVPTSKNQCLGFYITYFVRERIRQEDKIKQGQAALDHRENVHNFPNFVNSSVIFGIIDLF